MRPFQFARGMVLASHDGLAWRVCALKGGRGEWTCAASVEEASRNARQLPKRVLDFLAQSGARRLRILLSGDVHALATALPEDATNEELHAALAYEAQGEIGLEAAGHRLAAVRTHLLGMGGERNTLLTASFETDHLGKLAAESENEGVRFEAAGSLELALLAAHAQRAPERRLLLVRERTSFYAVPANEPQPFAVAMLPLGRDVAVQAAARERAERARERLGAHAAIPLTVALPRDADEQTRKVIATYFGGCRDVELVDGEELEAAAIRTAVAGSVGGVDSLCPWIGLPPPPRDPHRHGTAILGLILAVALVWAGMRRGQLKADLCAAQENRAAWQALEQARKQAKDEVNTLRDRQNATVARKTLLEKPKPLPKGLLPLLETLAVHMPIHSGLESIQQRGEGFEIAGVTHWQDGVPQLDAALSEMGRREKMRREFGGLEAVDGQLAQRFRFNVMPGGDGP